MAPHKPAQHAGSSCMTVASCVLAMAALPTLSPVFGAVNYAWSSAATSVWETATNWTPNSPAGGPTSVDSIITPTAFGQLQFKTHTLAVVDWTYNSSSNWEAISNVSGGVALGITGTLSKAGSGTLTFRPGGSTPLNMTVGDIVVSGGTLVFGGGTPGHQLTVTGSTTIAGTNALLRLTSDAGFTDSLGPVAFTGTGGRIYLNADATTNRNVNIQSLSSADTTSIVSPSSTSSSTRIATLQITGNSGTATYAGRLLNNAGGDLTSTLAIEKSGNNTQIFSGNLNTYSAGTTVSAGTLLLNNATGSGTGVGNVIVNGGTLGGTGRIAPTGSNAVTVNAGGKIAPGPGSSAGIESLELNFAATTGGLTMAANAAFAFELGAAGATIADPVSGINSDTLLVTGASAGDVAFNANVIDLLGTGEIGWYKLFDTDLASGTTWSGFGGLTLVNLAPGLTGTLVLGDGTTGSFDDIYLYVTIPEPASLGLLALGGLMMVNRRRRD